ncbi:hypothetical protein Y032_0025g1221 [Ancylostoma ceylanicum]|uniref:Uncharacterized protein n=1 Tax=Ancylostoma ceylanicum TaxID=53326 RepID=A0A016UWP6_9BILA|nr:hypothetical protein Y032_0025g1221 [Ancylostoma ceylanicum]
MKTSAGVPLISPRSPRSSAPTMANVRLLSFSYTYSIVDTDDPVAEFPKEVEDSMNQIKLETAGAYVPTPVPAEDRNKPEGELFGC